MCDTATVTDNKQSFMSRLQMVVNLYFHIIELHFYTIQQCIIIGDFLSLQSIEDVEKVLTGIPFDVRAVTQALDPLPLELYFGSISRDEVLKCFQEG